MLSVTPVAKFFGYVDKNCSLNFPSMYSGKILFKLTTSVPKVCVAAVVDSNLYSDCNPTAFTALNPLAQVWNSVAPLLW